jgi:hypothetical protein
LVIVPDPISFLSPRLRGERAGVRGGISAGTGNSEGHFDSASGYRPLILPSFLGAKSISILLF